MAKPSDQPGFKALLEEWNRKLEESGFNDIETISRGERVLKQPGTQRRYERMDLVTREAKEQFFRRVSGHVSQTQFDCPLELEILTLYSQGTSQADIQRVLKIEGHRCKVYYPLYRWLKTWGLKR